MLSREVHFEAKKSKINAELTRIPSRLQHNIFPGMTLIGSR